ncbi:MAG: hypothetical protein ABI083_14590 [Lapillicoccus sp.]
MGLTAGSGTGVRRTGDVAVPAAGGDEGDKGDDTVPEGAVAGVEEGGIVGVALGKVVGVVACVVVGVVDRVVAGVVERVVVGLVGGVVGSGPSGRRRAADPVVTAPRWGCSSARRRRSAGIVRPRGEGTAVRVLIAERTAVGARSDRRSKAGPAVGVAPSWVSTGPGPRRRGVRARVPRR